MKCSLFVICFLAVLITLICRAQYVASYSSFPILLIISMDAFRHDFVDECLTPTLYAMRSKGVYAPYLENVFPTKTFPNHHTIATGVFPEVHGVLDNTVYIAKDPCGNKSVVGYSYELFHANEEVVPLWTLNQMADHGRHSGVMMWPGGDFPYGERRIRPTFWRPAAFNVSFEARVDEVIRWFTNPERPANLVFMYFEEPDLHGHAYGIDSEQVRVQLTRLDNAVAYLQKRLAAKMLEKLVNIFILSDHGMVSITRDHIVDLTKYVDPELYVAASNSPALQIFPKPGSENAVLNSLLQAQRDHPEALDVYRREEIPKVWHYAGSPRAPPILVVAKEGYGFQDLSNSMDDLEKRFHIRPSPDNHFGIHGYDNHLSSMKPLFQAWGPALSAHGRIEPFNTTDLFPTWASLLRLPLANQAGPFAEALTKILRPEVVSGAGDAATAAAAAAAAGVRSAPRSVTETPTDPPKASAQAFLLEPEEPPRWVTTTINYISWITGIAATFMAAAAYLIKLRRNLRGSTHHNSAPEIGANSIPVCLDPRLHHDIEAQHLLTSSDCEDS